MGKITVKNVGKAYKGYSRQLHKYVERLFPFLGTRHRLNWVLKDISFEVSPGEAVGVVGVNGAGKSTLLKMITGTSQPTCGSIEMEGRVAALLELGMGFHPEFSGRENAYMSGYLLGMSRQEMDTLMPSIEEFADIGDYIDMPVRVYSSGMQVRLAFSVATAVRPDILIVDEALSVGDVYFQNKCLERIKEFCEKGTTLLFVSHDTVAIQAICNKAILLESGGISKIGSPKDVMDYYNAKLSKNGCGDVTQEMITADKVVTKSGTGEATVTSVRILNESLEETLKVNVGEKVTLQIKVLANTAIDQLVVGYMFKDRLGLPVYGENTLAHGIEISSLEKGKEIIVNVVLDMKIGIGTYSVTTALTPSENHLNKNFEWKDNYIYFDVENNTKPNFVGSAWLDTRVDVIDI